MRDFSLHESLNTVDKQEKRYIFDFLSGNFYLSFFEQLYTYMYWYLVKNILQLTNALLLTHVYEKNLGFNGHKKLDIENLMILPH